MKYATVIISLVTDLNKLAGETILDFSDRTSIGIYIRLVVVWSMSECRLVIFDLVLDPLPGQKTPRISPGPL